MTEDDIKTLRELAEESRPMHGREIRWTANALAVVHWQAFADGVATTVPQSFAEAFTTRDAEFIAAANPTAIVALLNERDALRDQIQTWRNWSDEVAPPWGRTDARDDAAQRELISNRIAAFLRAEQAMRGLAGERDALSAKFHTLTAAVQQLSRERAELVSDLVVADKRVLELTDTIAKLGETIGAQGKLIEELKAARDELRKVGT